MADRFSYVLWVSLLMRMALAMLCCCNDAAYKLVLGGALKALLCKAQSLISIHTCSTISSVNLISHLYICADVRSIHRVS